MNPNQALWEQGDFTRIAASMRDSGEDLVHKLRIQRGMQVLDLGCGTGRPIAAHVLARADWDDSRNRAVYGKCANPSGHGHNYRVEVTLEGAPEAGRALDEIVRTGGAVVAELPPDAPPTAAGFPRRNRIIAGLADALPEESVRLFDLARAGRLDEARALYDWFLPLLRLDTVPKFVQLIKLVQSEVGMGSERVRPPRLELVGAERFAALATIRTALERRPGS